MTQINMRLSAWELGKARRAGGYKRQIAILVHEADPAVDDDLDE